MTNSTGEKLYETVLVQAPVETSTDDLAHPEVSEETEVSSVSPAEVSTVAPGEIRGGTPGAAPLTVPQTGELHLSAVSSIKSPALRRMQDTQNSLFGSLLIMLLAVKLLFGSFALATILVWYVILFALTWLLVLSARFAVSVEEFGIVISRHHWLGQDVLKLLWNEIKSIEQIDEVGAETSRLNLKVKSGALGKIQSMIFQDIISAPDTVSISPEPSKRLPQDAGVNSTGSPESETGEFFRRLAQFCPQELLTTGHTPGSAPLKAPNNAADGKGSYAIPYLPVNEAQKKCSKYLKSIDKWLMLVMTLLALALTLFWGVLSSLTFFILVIGALLVLVFAARDAKYSLLFSEEGITVVWAAPGSTQRSKLIPWKAVEHVACNAKFAWNGERKARIEFSVNTSVPGAEHLLVLQDKSVCLGMLRSDRDRSVLSLDTAGLPDPQSKHELLTAINHYLSPGQVDGSVREALNPCDPASYTQLWLDAFSNKSARRFEGRLAPGHMLRNGCFEIVEFLAAGGQANVYLARVAAPAGSKENDAVSPSAVVLKEFILPCHAGAELSLRSLANIQKELDLMKQLQHPGIVRYHDIFVEDHRCYLVLEHIEGRCLRTVVETGGPLPEDQVLKMAVQMAEILMHLHGQTPPVVHRDFSPENLMLAGERDLKLIDFTVAQELEESATRTIVGKHCFLPPEQFRGKPCPQSDIYAMGATLYYLLTGEEPEPITCSHPMVKLETISAELDSLVAHATELELAQRFQKASDLLKELVEMQAKHIPAAQPQAETEGDSQAAPEAPPTIEPTGQSPV
jgi:hypothetical protein